MTVANNGESTATSTAGRDYLQSVVDDINMWIRLTEQTNYSGTKTKRQVSNFLLVYTFGAYQKIIHDSIIQRIGVTQDDNVVAFIKKMLWRLNMTENDLQRVVISTLGSKKNFTLNKMVSQHAINNFDKMRRDRNRAAHGECVHLEPKNVLSMHNAAKTVVLELEKIILDKTRSEYDNPNI